MGHWIKENKFEAGLLFVVLLLVGGAYVLGSGQGKKYRDHKDNYDAAVSQKKTLESKKPYPSAENVDDYSEQIDGYQKVIDGLQAALVKFRPKQFEAISPAEFTDKLNNAIATATQTYTRAKIEFPADKWRLGFERYTETPPKDDATAYLSYQLDAMSWLFDSLAKVRPSALINVYRPELPVEEGKPMDGEEPASGSRRSSSSRGSAPTTPFYRLPVEITFKAPEPAVRTFLAEVASSKEHFFVIRSMRIQNERRDKAPKMDDVEFTDDAGGAFEPAFEVIPEEGGEEPAEEGDPPTEEPLFPDEDPGDAPDAGGGGNRMLGQVLGAEEIFVFLELELILFQADEDDEGEKEAGPGSS